MKKLALALLSAALLAGCGTQARATGADARTAGTPEAQRAARAGSYTNPVIDHDFADPQVLKSRDGYFYAYATQTPVEGGRMANITTSRSRDLVHWEPLGDAMPTKPSWAASTQNFWAPHVLEEKGRYVMYFAGEPDNHKGYAVGVAIAKSPRGPFVATGQFLVQSDGFQAIDPMPFDDPKSGKHYLYWGSGFAPIHVQELSADRLSFAPGSERIDAIKPADAPYEHLVEGAWTIYRDGWYYLFYSGDDCCSESANYAVMVARAKSPLGPFEKLADATKRPTSVILKGNDRWLGPGHNAVVTDARGQDWIVYHAIDARNRYLPNSKAVRRPLMIDPITYKDGWPQIGNGTPSSESRTGPAL